MGNEGTGLYYYRARYYDPTRSRFISEDPIGSPGGINRYAYVEDHSQSSSDPLGLIEWPLDAPTPWIDHPDWLETPATDKGNSPCVAQCIEKHRFER